MCLDVLKCNIYVKESFICCFFIFGLQCFKAIKIARDYIWKTLSKNNVNNIFCTFVEKF